METNKWSLVYFLPRRLYDKNFATEARAKLVTGPVVSSDRITSKNGSKNKREKKDLTAL